MDYRVRLRPDDFNSNFVWKDRMMECLPMIIVVILAVGVAAVMALCAIAPLFISKDMTEGDDPAVKIGQGE